MDELHDLKAINQQYDLSEEKIDTCLVKCIFLRVVYMDISLLLLTIKNRVAYITSRGQREQSLEKFIIIIWLL
jgi:hypothetical protein